MRKNAAPPPEEEEEGNTTPLTRERENATPAPTPKKEGKGHHNFTFNALLFFFFQERVNLTLCNLVTPFFQFKLKKEHGSAT